jgi:GNAT superfamily N-acetyltransferase
VLEELASALAFDRGVRERAATRTFAVPHGLVVLHDRLPTLHHLNAVILDGCEDAESIGRLADSWLSHLGHRHVIVDDPAAAAHAPAGWTVQRTVLMSWRGGRVERDERAREIDAAEQRALQLKLYVEERGRPSALGDALIATLLAGQEEVRAGTRSLCFGAGEDGSLSSSCTLLCEPGGVALLEEVGTLSAFRGRGLGRAVVVASVAAALARGCRPIVVPADAEDWPQLMYARLGFEPIGIQVSFTLVS